METQISSKSIALKFAEKFQASYPKQPIWKLMVELEKDINSYYNNKKSWISIKDKMPPYNISVLTIDEDDMREICYLTNSNKWNASFHMYTKTNVTHWMPLPERPSK